MQTPSHLLLTAFVATQVQKQTAISIPLSALLVGSVLPDLPFTVLTIAGEVYFRWFAPLPVTGMSVMEYLHFDRFFNDPVWIISHNFFHSFVINGLLMGIGWWAYRSDRWWGSALFWCATSMVAHTVIDIFTHRSDGPLFLFPLNWTYRFPSPISYWETNYFGRYFSTFEWLLNSVLVIYFVVQWGMQRQRKQSTDSTLNQ